jgi:hypothetical protein
MLKLAPVLHPPELDTAEEMPLHGGQLSMRKEFVVGEE